MITEAVAHWIDQGEQGDEEVEPVIDRAERHRIRAHAHERGLRDRWQEQREHPLAGA